jgi:hypothetical protein
MADLIPIADIPMTPFFAAVLAIQREVVNRAGAQRERPSRPEAAELQATNSRDRD